ncbi:MAG: substrate-binding domain-containing protein [Vallitaleaceae bacterium]|nr:substrate-binding domain-containing protein [Vallitaleaceae bacterium]
MKTNISKRIIVVILLVALLIIAFLKVRFIDNTKLEVIVINKCNYDVSEFWEVAYAGMLEAIEEYDVTCYFMSAQYEYQIEEQKEVILKAIEMKPDVILLIASDYYEIAPYANMIIETGIELVLMDSDVDISDDYNISFIGTNSKKAGEYLGEVALENTTTANKNSIILSHFKGVQTSDDREAGIKEGYGEDYILGSYSCDSDTEVAYEITKKLILEDESIINIFATNENVTVGAARAVEELGLADRIAIYGFDSSKEHVRYLEMGILDYTIIQSPYQMGYLALKKSIDIVENKEAAANIETDFLLIGEDNMYDVGFREILFPFVDKK